MTLKGVARISNVHIVVIRYGEEKCFMLDTVIYDYRLLKALMYMGKSLPKHVSTTHNYAGQCTIIRSNISIRVGSSSTSKAILMIENMSMTVHLIEAQENTVLIRKRFLEKFRR